MGSESRGPQWILLINQCRRKVGARISQRYTYFTEVMHTFLRLMNRVTLFWPETIAVSFVFSLVLTVKIFVIHYVKLVLVVLFIAYHVTYSIEFSLFNRTLLKVLI